MSSRKRGHLLYNTVDAFTSTPFSGNQAAVIVLPSAEPWPSDSFLQQIASEFNYAETAFTRKIPFANHPNTYGLRWFTPEKEVKLCGHATLATAWVLKNRPELLPEPLVGREIIFDTLSGELEVALMGGDKSVEFMMNFPGDFQIEASYLESWERLAEVLGLQSRDDIIGYSNSGGLHYAAIQVKNEVDIASLNVDSAALSALFPDELAQAVTCLSDEGEIVCRVFAWKAGIPEDPVTGSMYTFLGPQYNRFTNGKTEFMARQVSKRGGSVYVQVQEDGRVIVGGNAVGVMQGTLFY